jgi:hypothetical protein
MRKFAILAAITFLTTQQQGEAAPVKRTAKEALQAFQDLIGSWRGTGQPFGTKEERDKGFWVEKIAWQWQFKGDDAWLLGTIAKGKQFTRFELRYLPAKDLFQLETTNFTKTRTKFQGKFEKKKLTMEYAGEKAALVQRLTITLLHSNRFLYRLEERPKDVDTFKQIFQVGATKEGVAFAAEDDKPECVVSGGLGTIKVSYKGTPYFVCCTGCRDAFNDDPLKYIKEFEARKKAKKKE